MWEAFMTGLSNRVGSMVEPMAMPRRYRRLVIATFPLSLPILLAVAAIMSVLLVVFSMLDSIVYELRNDGLGGLWNDLSIWERPEPDYHGI